MPEPARRRPMRSERARLVDIGTWEIGRHMPAWSVRQTLLHIIIYVLQFLAPAFAHMVLLYRFCSTRHSVRETLCRCPPVREGFATGACTHLNNQYPSVKYVEFSLLENLWTAGLYEAASRTKEYEYTQALSEGAGDAATSQIDSSCTRRD